MTQPDRAAIERGRQWEKLLAAGLGGELIPGSGNQWHNRSDVKAAGLLISAKSETKRTWAQTLRELGEAITYAVGSGLVPALGVQDPESGEELIIMRLSDASEWLADKELHTLTESKGQIRRRQAGVPVLHREGAS